ncbi:MAG: hypothetical protein MZV49_25250 [Rhodopseudomonas palustris]|nr:hypothetical protein [Rhodopseudomonas palustris]
MKLVPPAPPGPAGPCRSCRRCWRILPRWIAASLTCTECHNDTAIITGKKAPWETSGHGSGTAFVEEADRNTCVFCHSGASFSEAIAEGKNFTQVEAGDCQPDPPGLPHLPSDPRHLHRRRLGARDRCRRWPWSPARRPSMAAPATCAPTATRLAATWLTLPPRMQLA